MKYLLPFLGLFFLTYSASAQQFTIGINKQNILYVGLDNPISVSVASTDCDSVKLESAWGELEGSACRYKINPTRLGDLSFRVLVKRNGHWKLLGKARFRVIPIPNPTARLSRHQGGNISKSEVLVQEGLIAQLDNFDIDMRARILSYKILLIQKKGKAKYVENGGARFSKRTKFFLSKIKQGDLLYFVDILARVPGNPESIELNSLSFRIQE